MRIALRGVLSRGCRMRVGALRLRGTLRLSGSHGRSGTALVLYIVIFYIVYIHSILYIVKLT
jgi:hypothetical protein